MSNKLLNMLTKKFLFSMERKTLNAFIICPVRGVEYDGDFYRGLKTIEKSFGVKFHFPPRDTNQNDPTGLQICKDNCDAIKNADIVFVLWDGKSQGVLFDLGMAFAMGKNISVIDIPDETEGKSFQNMMRAWEKSNEN